MRKAKFLLLLAFVMVCAAGAVVGMVVDRRVTAPPPGPRGGPFRALNLTPDQQEKMKSIWSDVVRLREQRFQSYHDLEIKRHQDIADLFSAYPELKARYQQIQKDYADQVKELEDHLQQSVRDAEQRTHDILTPEQQKKYDEVREQMRFRGREGPHRRGDHPRAPMHAPPGPTTHPASVALVLSILGSACDR